MVRWRVIDLAFGASAALILSAVPSLAQEAAGCAFVCKLTGQSAGGLVPPAPEPAQAAAQDPAAVPAAAPRVRVKPRIVPLLIAAGAPEMARTRALVAGLKAQSVRIVASSKSAAADLTIGPQVRAVRGAPLFREDLHVIGRADLQSLADLEGRTVSLGMEGSTGQAIAREILAVRGIHVREVPLDLDNALDGVATGDLDAVFVFAPQPFARLNDLPGETLHLVGVPAAVEDEKDMAPAFIAASAYPKFAATAPTPTLSVAVHAIAQPHGAHVREAAAVVAALTAKARKTVAARPLAEQRSVAVSR